MNMPLPIMIESARGEMLNALERIRGKYNLPACIIDGILSSVLADVRGEQKIEVINGLNQIIQEMTEELDRAKKEAKKVLPEDAQEITREHKKCSQNKIEEGIDKNTMEEERDEYGANKDT